MLQRSAGVVLAVALLLFLLQRSPAPQRAHTPTQAPASHPRLHHDSYSLPPAIPSPADGSLPVHIPVSPTPSATRPAVAPTIGRDFTKKQVIHLSIHTRNRQLHDVPTGPRPRQGFLPSGRRQHISPLLLLLLYGGQSPFSHPAPRIINQKSIQNKCNSRS